MEPRALAPAPERRLSYRLAEVEALTGLGRKRLRSEAALGNLTLTKVGPRTTLVMAADLDAFLARARQAAKPLALD